MGNEIVRTRISRKTVGRNKGFVLTIDVKVEDQTKQIKYYAKIQEFELDMVLSHWILKEMKCGPERCFFVPIKRTTQASDKLGIITEEVKNLHIAQGIGSSAYGHRVLNHAEVVVTDAFLLSIAVQLCKFSRIPDNRGNWGFVGLDTDWEQNADRTHRLSIIDFSSCDYYEENFETKSAFVKFWATNVRLMIKRCSIADILRRNVAHWERTMRAVLDQQTQHFPWLHSKATFTAARMRPDG